MHPSLLVTPCGSVRRTGTGNKPAFVDVPLGLGNGFDSAPLLTGTEVLPLGLCSVLKHTSTHAAPPEVFSISRYSKCFPKLARKLQREAANTLLLLPLANAGY